MTQAHYGSYASLLIQAIEQIRSKKPFGLPSTLARLQLERFFPPSANLRKNHIMWQKLFPKIVLMRFSGQLLALIMAENGH